MCMCPKMQAEPHPIQESSNVQSFFYKMKEKVEEKKSSKQNLSNRKQNLKKSRKVGRWKLGKTLGKGGYSWFVNYLVISILSRQKYAGQ